MSITLDLLCSHTTHTQHSHTTVAQTRHKHTSAVGISASQAVYYQLRTLPVSPVRERAELSTSARELSSLRSPRIHEYHVSINQFRTQACNPYHVPLHAITTTIP